MGRTGLAFDKNVDGCPNREVPFRQFGEAALNVGVGVLVELGYLPLHARRVCRGEFERVYGQVGAIRLCRYRRRQSLPLLPRFQLSALSHQAARLEPPPPLFSILQNLPELAWAL